MRPLAPLKVQPPIAALFQSEWHSLLSSRGFQTLHRQSVIYCYKEGPQGTAGIAVELGRDWRRSTNFEMEFCAYARCIDELEARFMETSARTGPCATSGPIACFREIHHPGASNPDYYLRIDALVPELAKCRGPLGVFEATAPDSVLAAFSSALISHASRLSELADSLLNPRALLRTLIDSARRHTGRAPVGEWGTIFLLGHALGEQQARSEALQQLEAHSTAHIACFRAMKLL